MSYPKIKLPDREIIVLSGFDQTRCVDGKTRQPVIVDISTLASVAAAHEDAVAFGYVKRKWWPAA